jgi:hypothetical protein
MQGLPVFHAPGEAEAVCAALAQAGCVDACATFDSDVLLYGAETVYQTLKLSVRGPCTSALSLSLSTLIVSVSLLLHHSESICVAVPDVGGRLCPIRARETTQGTDDDCWPP